VIRVVFAFDVIVYFLFNIEFLCHFWKMMKRNCIASILNKLSVLFFIRKPRGTKKPRGFWIDRVTKMIRATSSAGGCLCRRGIVLLTCVVRKHRRSLLMRSPRQFADRYHRILSRRASARALRKNAIDGNRFSEELREFSELDFKYRAMLVALQDTPMLN